MESNNGGSNPFADCFWPEVTPAESHAVLYELPLSHDGQPPKPRTNRHGSKWDQQHVRLPCAPESQFPDRRSDGTSEFHSRWDLIQTALLERPITNSVELELAIFSYNTSCAKSWDFQGLHCFFENEIEARDSECFFSDILPKIIRLALQLPAILPTSIPLLKCGQNHSISMTQQQIASLLANAFLCTFPLRNQLRKSSEYHNFPDVNFNRLYSSTQQSVMEKIKCLCNYFRRVTTRMPIGVVTFRRRSLPPKLFPIFSESLVELRNCKLSVRANGTIEREGRGLLQVDFANKIIGGGVLGQGCVQEEIRFVICPELLITRLFTEMLKPDEALFIIGAEQFSLYSGYANTFEFAGDFVDPTPLDGNQRRLCQIVAIDALPFRDPKHQFRPALMLRELTKAFVGFGRSPAQKAVAPGVGSGNWGCGAFNGHAHLKSLLQLMVCAAAGRPLVYFTFGDHGLVADLQAMYEELCAKRVTVGDLWRILEKFSKRRNPDGDELFDFIREELNRGEKEEEKQRDKRCDEVKSTVSTFFRSESRTWSWSKEARKEDAEEKRPFAYKSFGNIKKRTTFFNSNTTTQSLTRPRDTDDEMQVEQERKKKMNSPSGSGGGGGKWWNQKLPRRSLLDGLEAYASKEKGYRAPSTSTSGSGSGRLLEVAGSAEVDMVEEEEDKNNNKNEKLPATTDQEVVPASEEMEMETETVAKSTFDVVVQIDEEGGEFFPASPPPPVPERATARTPMQSSGGRHQTTLKEFFKREVKSDKE